MPDAAISPESPRRPTAAGRLLTLLGAFAHGDGSLRLSEISRLSGLSLTTTHRLVGELLDHGGLELDGDHHYRLSSWFLEIASSSTRGLRLRETALPHLVDLHRRSGLTVHLAVRDGDNVLNVEVLRLHPNFGGAGRIGGSARLHVGSTGLILLAFAPSAEIERYLTGSLPAYTAATICDPATLRAQLAAIRSEDQAISRGTPVEGVGTVAAPVRAPDGDVTAAIGVACWLERQDPADYAGLVRATARRVSLALAARAPEPSPRSAAFRRRNSATARRHE